TSDYVYGPGGRVVEQLSAQPAISFIGAGNAGDLGTASSLTVTLPAGVATGDQILLASTQPASATPTTPAGYTAAGTYASGSAPNSTTTALFRRAAAGGESSVRIDY